MNTVGKMLVILNFLFAVIVGALLVMDVAVRNQWKLAYHELKREADVLKTGRDTDAKAMASITADYQRKTLEFEKIKQDVADDKTMVKSREDDYKLQVANLIEKLGAKDVTVKEIQKALDRNVFENDEHKKTIQDRQALIVKLELDIKVVRVELGDLKGKYQTALSRNEGILEQLQAFSKQNAMKEQGINPDRPAIKTATDRNPPAVLVNGKVEKVEGTEWMEISLGTDHGVNKNDTLDVYRLQPEPKYLGMIRIVSANTHKSVAKLVPSGNQGFRPVLRAGDLVTSKVTKSD